MAFELPTLPFPRDSLNTPYIASPDNTGKYTVVSSQWFKGQSNWTPVSNTDPLPVTVIENMELYGADISERPSADSVPKGCVFILIASPLQVWMSNGTSWVEVD